MADPAPNGAPANDAAPTLNALAQYAKDLSFERAFHDVSLQVRAGEVLAEIGVAETATLFTGWLRDLGEARRVARQAWDLGEIAAAYEDFLTAVDGMAPADDPQAFAELTRLVQEWRRFPFLDPALPPDLLPRDWTGWRAHDLFHTRHDAWHPAAARHWTALTGE